MNDDPLLGDLLFEVPTPLGFSVRVTRSYWELICTIKHLIMIGREAAVKAALISLDEIRLSRSDSNVYLFYKTERMGRWVCAVTRRLDEEGLLITAYPTDAIKEGERIWPK